MLRMMLSDAGLSIYVATDGLHNLLLAQWTRFGDKKVIFPIPPRYTKRDVLFLKGLLEAGQYRPVIDRRYPLAEVIEANRYVDRYVVRTRVAAGDGGLGQRFGRRHGGICGNGAHQKIPLRSSQ